MTRPRKTKPQILGREAFAKISAVEGIALDEEAEAAFADFDRRTLSPDKRRRAIIARFRRRAANWHEVSS